MMQHLSGQKHLKLYHGKEEQMRIARKCGIFVTGYPPYICQEIILKYFFSYGKVVFTYFGNYFLLVDYAEPSDALTVLRGNHYLGGRKLTVQYRELRTQQPFNKYSQIEDHDDFHKQLKNMKTLSEQVTSLAEYLEVGNNRKYPVYMRVCDDLQNSLQYTFPRVQIFPFGSTITGLDFKNSDIDLYIKGVRNRENNVPFLYKIKHILMHSQRFTNCIVIAHAKIPILKCIHIESNINCDINIKNKLGVCNSELINYYLKLDFKIREAMVIIKYWAKIHKIAGQNHLFTNYSLSLMMIFFLQQKPHEVPSVRLLQEDEKFASYQDGWNGGFKQKEYNNYTLRNISLAELLADFFEFYSNFDYSTFIICPYLGVKMKKEAFKTPEQLPEHYNTYKDFIKVEGNVALKVEVSICIQDPFEHSRNATPAVSESTLNIFINLCRQGKQICKDGPVGLLYKLLTEKTTEYKSEQLLKCNFSQFTVPMGINVKYLSKNIDDNVSNRRQVIEEEWFESANKFLVTVLKEFLNFDVKETTKEDTDIKAKRSEGQTDVHDKEKIPVFSYRCSAKLDLWQLRKSTLKNLNTKDIVGIVNKEKEVTKQLLMLYKDLAPTEKILDFEITIQKKSVPVQLLIDLTKICSYKKTFKSFCTFFAANFIYWFETYEKELNGLS
ncbi:LOW QUALITY PROTEIN: speckle targeted PIP5K1A-regulated poly(A) polymerase [Leptinotarsa decemlineata]|uniref:LOW QUALITY PROTEIN: speckle targeted PIP5K1A-regulated poly(A) polymerase n=1 Tax=Leptinotarsa decemlineata TaxID=7539 RepID=UPI003D305FCC